MSTDKNVNVPVLFEITAESINQTNERELSKEAGASNKITKKKTTASKVTKRTRKVSKTKPKKTNKNEDKDKDEDESDENDEKLPAVKSTALVKNKHVTKVLEQLKENDVILNLRCDNKKKHTAFTSTPSGLRRRPLKAPQDVSMIK